MVSAGVTASRCRSMMHPLVKKKRNQSENMNSRARKSSFVSITEHQNQHHRKSVPSQGFSGSLMRNAPSADDVIIEDPIAREIFESIRRRDTACARSARRDKKLKRKTNFQRTSEK
ncbi:unnamed protein product [Oikopleura dioica]|uniref:Uncharacterized protein n=1 Tax=Oikopleura dioica TaxID=34765 RepID=E4WZQ2_OIKDI|nr:unnamed protein product [Oikopleura dioica]